MALTSRDHLRAPDSTKGLLVTITGLTTAKLRQRKLPDGLINEYGQAAWLPSASHDFAGQRP